MVTVKVLGSGNAFNQNNRLNSSYLISTSNEKILFDCGFTSPLALQKENIEFNSIDTIVISHYHGDHFAGIAALLLGLKYVSIQNKKLRIIGPGDVQSKIFELIRVLYPGSEDLLEELNIEFISVVEKQGRIKFDDYSLLPIPMIHSEGSDPFGYVFKFNNTTIGFSGDTSWHKGVEDLLIKSDHIFLECNFEEKIGKGHLSVTELNESNLVQEKKSYIYLTHLHEGSYRKAIDHGYTCVEDGAEYQF